MPVNKQLLFYINLFGGSAVLGSYAWGFFTHANASTLLWGGVPDWMRPYYSIGMLMAALGYFAFTYYIFFRLDPTQARVFSRFGFSAFNVIYAAILFPSACWMPFTFLAIQAANPLHYWLVRTILIVVGLSSICLFVALLSIRPHHAIWVYRFALVGSIFFCIQTALLDAAIWGSFFRLP
jgi:hypothetical protein